MGKMCQIIVYNENWINMIIFTWTFVNSSRIIMGDILHNFTLPSFKISFLISDWLYPLDLQTNKFFIFPYISSQTIKRIHHLHDCFKTLCSLIRFKVKFALVQSFLITNFHLSINDALTQTISAIIFIILCFCDTWKD